MTISDQSKVAHAPRASLRPVFHFLNFFLNVPSNFLRWYSAGRKRLGPPGLPSRICGLRPQGLGLRSARRAGQQCASKWLCGLEVVVRSLSFPFPVPTELVAQVCKELWLQRLGANIRNHFAGAQVHRDHLHVLNFVSDSHNCER